MQVIADQHGSDHFPIGIHSYTAAPSVTNGTWKLSKADWVTFSSKASSELGQIRPGDVEDAVEHFTYTLINIAVPYLKANLVLKNAILSGFAIGEKPPKKSESSSAG